MISGVNCKAPEECGCIEDVRGEIDRIDREIVNLLAARTAYVHEVVKYKAATPEAIEAPERRAAVLQSRSRWASEAGMDPDVIGDIFGRLVQYYIDEEKRIAL